MTDVFAAGFVLQDRQLGQHACMGMCFILLVICFMLLQGKKVRDTCVTFMCDFGQGRKALMMCM